MVYNETYAADDADDVIIDILVTVLVSFVSFATLIGLVMLWGYFKKKAK